MRGGPGIWALAWPAILGNLLQTSVAAVAVIAIGRLGAVALAASAVGERIFFMLQAVLIGITAGTAALVARAWGAGRRDEAALLTRTSLWICAGVAGTLSLLGASFAREIAGIFRLEREALDLAARYTRWLLAFNPAFATFLALASALRAAGDTRSPLLLGGLANLLNAALLFPLVFGAFGLPGLGLPGAALAAGVSMTLCTGLFLWLWRSGWLRIGVGLPGPAGAERIGQLLRVGYPAGLEQGVFQIGFVVFLWIVSFYGTEAYAAYSIGVRILSFSFVIGAGFSIASSTLVGQNLGAGDVAGARHSGWRACGQSVAAMSAFGLTISLFAEPIARFTVDDPEVVRLAVAFIHIFGAVQPLMALEFALAGALRGAGDTRFPLYTALAGMLAVRATLAGLARLLDLPVEWVFAALIGDYLAKSLLLVARFRSGRWQHAVAPAIPQIS